VAVAVEPLWGTQEVQGMRVARQTLARLIASL